MPRDPDNVYGQFDNGFHYVVRHAPNPQGKVSLQLLVQTGALNETEHQDGLAHFLEHMAFKGSDHFQPMHLIPLLAHLGMTFGADTNARTGEVDTVYKLSMPDTKAGTIDTALTIFADYANGLKFYPVQIDSERRVILEEARTKKSAAQRLNRALVALMFPGSRLVTHDVIGDDERIKTFQQSDFLDYWNTWYRPENMTLIVVGDIDPQAIIAAARAKLGTFQPRAAGRPSNTAGISPFTQTRAFVLTDPEQVTAKVSLDCVQPSRAPMTTFSQYRQEVLDHLAEWIVNRRLTAEIAKGGAPYRSCSVGAADLYNDGHDASVEAEGEAKDWHAMLDAMIAQINSAMGHGFTPREVELAQRGMISGGEWGLKTEASRDSKAIANELAAQIGSNSPIMSAQQKLDLTKTILSTVSPRDLQQAFCDLFSTKHFTYAILLPSAKESLTVPSDKEVMDAAAAAWARNSDATPQLIERGLILPAEPSPGVVADRTDNSQLGVTTVVYENGVVMHHKFIDSDKDQVVVQITLPGGPIEETAATKGLSSLAAQILSHPATHRLTSTQIRDLMVGDNVGVGGQFSLDSLKINVGGSPADLPVGLQLVHALLTDGVLEQPAFNEWQKAELDALHERPNSASAQLNDLVSSTIGGGDIRLTPLTVEVVNRVTRQAAQDWFTRIARHSAIEVAVVGDLQLQQAIDLVGRYLGSLPKRTGTFTDLDPLRKLDRPAGPFVKTVTFTGVTPKAVVLAGFVGCEELNPDRRPLALASAILSDRMIQRIRVEDNLVYSINCISIPGQGLPGLGQIVASAPTDPINADRLATTIVQMIKELAEMGPTELELETAKNEITNTLDTQMKSSGFWIAQLSQLNYHKHHLDELQQLPDVFQTFRTTDIQTVLGKYVTDQAEIRLAAVPSPGDKPQSSATSTAPAPEIR